MSIKEKIFYKFSVFVLIFILIFSFLLMFLSSIKESATMDELAHIPSGYSYVKFLDYRLNPEHPPLLKALSGIPLLFLNLNFPIQSDAWQKYINGQWDVGREFLYESGNDADLIIQWSRIFPMLLTLGLVFLIYLWSRELFGPGWALLPSFLFALSPNILAHGHYVTTDIAAAFGTVLALYFFVKFLYFQDKKSIIYAGIAFGIAQLLKFSTFMLIPYFVFLVLVFWWANNKNLVFNGSAFKKLWNYFYKLILVFIISYLFVVYPVYFLFTYNYPQEKQISDTEFILTSFAGGPPKKGEICNPLRCLAEIDIWMTKNTITRPLAHYLLGVLMVMQRSAGGNTAYFMGEVSASGWKTYFPIVYLLKEPIPFLIMLFLAIIFWLKNIFLNLKQGFGYAKEKLVEYLNISFDKFSMIGFVLFYWFLSILSPLNIGFRHIIPTLPLFYILTTGSLKKWVDKSNFRITPYFLKNIFSIIGVFLKSSLKYLFIFILVFWFLIETVIAYPYFISYFNEFGGGIKNGYRYVTDSNYDWGQDLLRLRDFVEKNNISKIAVDYFGGGNPKYYLKDKVEYWWSARGNPKDFGINWLAVSINTLQGATARLHPGHQRNEADEYRWLVFLRPKDNKIGSVPKPDYIVGTSIFVYDLTK